VPLARLNEPPLAKPPLTTPRPPNPPKQPATVAGLTSSRVALTAPMSLVLPKAVAHSPTFSEPALPGPVRR
jgi:hypothetical protein